MKHDGIHKLNLKKEAVNTTTNVGKFSLDLTFPSWLILLHFGRVPLYNYQTFIFIDT